MNNNELRPPLPNGWPRDKRSRVNVVNGVLVLIHPKRPPHTIVDGKWQEIQKVA